MTWEMAKDATKDARDKVSEGVVSVIGMVQNATGLKLREGLGVGKEKASTAEAVVENRVEELKVAAEAKAEEVKKDGREH